MILFRDFMEPIRKSCDDLPTSLVYMDTTATPHKLLGHVQVESFDDRKRIVAFKNGSFVV